MKYLKLILWRLQFKKVKYNPSPGLYVGRCIKCDGGNPKVECAKYYCPCKMNEQLKRREIFKF